jgi:hypothetical protein
MIETENDKIWKYLRRLEEVVRGAIDSFQNDDYESTAFILETLSNDSCELAYILNRMRNKENV